MSTVGLAIIAKNEEKRLPELLASIEGAFDQVVLVDTGSIDRTKQVFDEWASKQKGLEYAIDYFHWSKDFAAARRKAQSLLTTDWEVWADCDDVVVGAQNLRRVTEQAPEEVAGFIAGYNYAQHPQTGACICYLKRERLVRRGKAEWVNRVHEAQVIDGPVQMIGREVCEWVHRKQAQSVAAMQEADARRNLVILEDWVKDEPDNTRVLAYLGTEHAARNEIDEALEWFTRYFAAEPQWDEERVQVHRKKAMCLIMKGDFDDAIQTAFEALHVLPTWTDSYITLAEAYHAKGEHDKAIEWAQEALRRGEPQTLLIINPMDYTYQPRKILAGSLASAGRLDEAVQIGNEAFQINPMDEQLARGLMDWRAKNKREHTANSIALLAQQLVAHDEQLKARILMESCIPHFAEDHHGLIQLRSMLRERLAWLDNPQAFQDHYATGGSKPEDFLPDEQLDEVPARLPRVAFLYEGIHEQLLEAHVDGLMKEAVDGQIQPMFEAIGAATDPA